MRIERSDATGRWKIDLFLGSRRVMNLVVGTGVTLGIVVIAWWVGRNDPVPAWITTGLVPALGWIYIALVVIAVAGWWRRRASTKRDRR